LRSEHEIGKFLVVLGGIPKYLEQIDPYISFENNIDQLCFPKSDYFHHILGAEDLFKPSH